MHRAEARTGWSQKLEYFGHKTEAAVQGLAQRVFTSAKAGLLVKLDERSCLGGSVTKKYKSSSYGNVTAEVTSTRVKPLCTCLTRAPRSMTC
jgi:hypothetical protein